MQARAARLGVTLGVGVVYFLAGKLARAYAVGHGNGTPVWPPTGLALAAVLLLGRGVWPAIFAGAFLVNLTTAGSVLSSLGIAAGNTLEALVGAFLVERFAGGAAAFERAPDIFKFVALAGLVSTTVSATLGVTTLALTGNARWADFGPIWLTWWLGDAAGDIVVVPFLLLAFRPRPQGVGARDRPFEALLLVAATTLTALVVFRDLMPSLAHYPLTYLCLPPLLWSAFRFGPRLTSALLVLLAALSIGGTSLGRAALERGEDRTESRAVRPDGGVRWIEGRAVAFYDGDGRPERLVGVCVDVTEEKRADARVAFLGEIARSITSSLDLDTVLRRIVEGAQALTNSDSAAVFLRDPPSGAMLPRQRVGPWWRGYEALRITPGQGLGGAVMVTGRPLRTDDYRAEARGPPDMRAVIDDTRTVALMVVPVLVGAEVAGLLYTSNRTPRSFTDEDETICVRLAEQAAVAIQNARLFGRQEAARAEAEAANRAKDEFLAMLGHELRNPLGAISNATHLLVMTESRGGDTTRARDIIARQVQHLTRLVDDLLDVSRVVAGKVVLRLQPVELAETARRIAALHGGGRHVIAVDSTPVWVSADPTRLEQILTNLMANAVKYTQPGGEIAVTVGREREGAVVRVRDSGAGIRPELLPRVFDLFVQGDRSLDRSGGGLGIGLTLVRHLVQLHGGTVEAGSEGPGRGRTVTPRPPVLSVAPAPADAASAPIAGPARRVLVVEDNDDARETLRNLLHLFGHEVHEARDGDTGVEEARRLTPDVALIDIGLPGIDGYEVARRIRADVPGARLVAVTGYGQPEDLERARAAGFDAHLVKPLDPRHLQEVLAADPGRSRPSGSL